MAWRISIVIASSSPSIDVWSKTSTAEIFRREACFRALPRKNEAHRQACSRAPQYFSSGSPSPPGQEVVMNVQSSAPVPSRTNQSRRAKLLVGGSVLALAAVAALVVQTMNAPARAQAQVAKPAATGP